MIPKKFSGYDQTPLNKTPKHADKSGRKTSKQLAEKEYDEEMTLNLRDAEGRPGMVGKIGTEGTEGVRMKFKSNGLK